MRELLLVLPVFILLAASPLAAGSTIRFQLGDQGGVIVPVRLNGAGPFLVLLDTGATNTAIAAGVAAAIGAPSVATASVVSSTGASQRTIVEIDRLALGPYTTNLVLASVVPDRSFDRKGTIQGLIGQDILANRRFTIDFDRRLLQWHTEEAPAHGVPLRMALENGRFLVDLPQQGEPLRLVPDSGAGGLILFNAERRGRTWFRHTGRTVQVETANGPGTGREVVLPRFQVGDQTLQGLPAVTIERPELRPLDGDGLLPLHLFDRVTFDGPRRLLFLG